MTQDTTPQPVRDRLRPKDFPTPEQVADDYDVTTETVRKWIRSGQLTAYRVGKRRLRVDPESLAQMMRPR